LQAVALLGRNEDELRGDIQKLKKMADEAQTGRDISFFVPTMRALSTIHKKAG